MSLVLLNLAAFLFMGFLIKKAVLGPQKNFARVSGILIFFGGLGLRAYAADQESFGFDVSGFILLIGILLFMLMVFLGNWWIIKKALLNHKK